MPHLRAGRFDLRTSVECGQLFTYELIDGWYYITRRSRLFAARQKGSTLEYRGADDDFIRWFFRLDDDLPAIQRAVSRDPVITRAFRSCAGLRLVRLDPWEAILSFLCSPACNIPRIRKVLRAVATNWGERLELDGVVMHSLPRPSALPGEKQLRAAGAGFRAAYIRKAAGAIDEDWLKALEKAGHPSAQEMLLALPGVGRKIADCVCLFSLGFLQAFPVDTWIKKIMAELYLPGSNPSDEAIRRFAHEYFGRYAGYAQQYLYTFYRGCPKEQWNTGRADARMPCRRLIPGGAP